MSPAPSRSVVPLGSTSGKATLGPGPNVKKWKELVATEPTDLSRFFEVVVRRDNGEVETWGVWAWGMGDDRLAIATVPGEPGDRFPTEPRFSPGMIPETSWGLLIRRTGQVVGARGWFASREDFLASFDKAAKP